MKNYSSVFKKFAKLNGSQHIASEFALKGIENIVKKFEVKSVFELGTGIGTIPYLVKSINKEIKYVGIEGNEFCIKVLYQNLEAFVSNYFELFETTDAFNKKEKFDLIIIDGKADSLNFIKNIVNKSSIVFIEGDRLVQVQEIKSMFPKSLIFRVITNKMNYLWSPFKSGFMGGYTLIFLKDTINFKLFYICSRIKTDILYRLRWLKKYLN